MIDAFLKDNPKLLTDDKIENGVAVIAKINDISSSNEHNVDGEPIEIRIGHGNLLEIIYIGDVFF